QFDFVTPGSCPRRAWRRKQMRHNPNLRMYARGRPQTEQRLRCCVLNLGGRRLLAIFDCLAIFLLALGRAERHAVQLKQTARLLVSSCVSPDGDLHSADLIDLVVLKLREDELLANAQGVVPSPIKRLRRNTAEIADAGQRGVDELVQEGIHLLTT